MEKCIFISFFLYLKLLLSEIYLGKGTEGHSSRLSRERQAGLGEAVFIHIQTPALAVPQPPPRSRRGFLVEPHRDEEDWRETFEEESDTRSFTARLKEI